MKNGFSKGLNLERKEMKKMKKILFMLLAVMFIASPAWAATFVNGDFETGNWTGWTTGSGIWD